MTRINWNSDERCFILTCEVVLPRSRQEIFEFFSDAFQLSELFPAEVSRAIGAIG